MKVSNVKTKEGTEQITAYLPEEVTLPELHFDLKRRKKKKLLKCREYAVFDSETSHTVEEGWIYQWAFLLSGRYVYGRKPSEFIQLLSRIRDRYELNRDKEIIIYIHNAAYDLQYLKHYLYEYDNEMEVLATDAHSIITLTVEGFRFICSYKLSNLSLDLFSSTYSEKYLKASGAIDYRILRYQDEELTATDWYYMFSDVASQHDAIGHYLESMGYQYAYDAPITSTGFVREACRKAAAAEPNWRKKFFESQLDLEQYQLARQAFMGGITICSWQHSGETITGNIGHKDFTSSYPARQMMDYAPYGKPFWCREFDSREEAEEYMKTYCCIFIAEFTELHIKPGITAPYIPSSKAIYKEEILKVNGKVVYAKRLVMAMTEIDYKWIKRQYHCDSCQIYNMLCFSRRRFPKFIRDKVMEYFRMKTDLKTGDQRLYMAAKALLNAIYGMSASRIIRASYKYDADLILTNQEEAKEEQLQKFYDNYKSFLPYQLGVYVTAHARNALMEMIETVGYDRFLYCDTDSVFYMSDPDTEKRLEAMNAKIRERAEAAGAVYNGVHLGEATDEKPISAFRGLHAKCYAMIEAGKLKVTIAGIPKQSIKFIDGKPVKKTNAEELGSLDNLKDGFTFSHCGGTRAIYVEDKPHIKEINGHVTELASACLIENISKEISDTMWTKGADYTILDTTMERLNE